MSSLVQQGDGIDRVGSGAVLRKELDKKHGVSAYGGVWIAVCSRKKGDWNRPISDATRTERKRKEETRKR